MDMTGKTVKFKYHVDEGDELERLIVLEDNGDRCLCRSLVYCTDWAIGPTTVYRKDQLELTA